MKSTLGYILICAVLLYSLGCIPKSVNGQTTVVPSDKIIYPQ